MANDHSLAGQYILDSDSLHSGLVYSGVRGGCVTVKNVRIIPENCETRKASSMLPQRSPLRPLGCGDTDGLGGGSGGGKVEQELVLDVRQTPGHHGPTGRDITGQHHLHDSVRLLLRRAVPTLSHAQHGV